MPITRHFLSWDSPVLPATAAWLWERHGPDMGGLIVALPAARAGRRLTELLAERAETERAILVPPGIETAGSLPERLYPSASEVDADGAGSPDAVADETAALLARAAALRSADPEVLQQVIPHPPAADDWPGWWRLAESLGELSRELSAARLTPAWVLGESEASRVDLGLGEPRWRALARLEADYEQTLGRDDRQMARRRVLKNPHVIGCGKSVVLVGLVDLSAQLAGLLGHLDAADALIPAPPDHAAGFDALGGLVVDYWQDQPVEVGDLRFVDRPNDQAAELVRVLGELPDAATAEAVSIGLGDEAAGAALKRTIELAGTPARVAAGKSLRDAAPAVLLDTLGRFAAQRRFADLAELVRHPDMTAVLGVDEPWPQRLDAYASQFMQAEVCGGWRGDEQTQTQMQTLRERIDAVLPDGAVRKRGLSDWSAPIADVLRSVYGRQPLHRFRDRDLVEALGQIGQALSDLAALGEAAETRETLPAVDFATAVSFVLGRLAAGRLPAAADGPAVELLGFLELPWDDAEFVVLTDFNEGNVPDSRQADAWLPDGLRGAIGLSDNARRYARDVVLLNIVLRSRARVAVLACQRGAAGDPLTPSRLLLACDDDTRIARVKAFYAEHEGVAAPGPLLLVPGVTSRFLIPRPTLDEPALEKLRVTAFRDYLACKYRFYLKHVLRLEAADDRAMEMDALAYGSLAHAVLEDFGRSSVADAADAAVIETMLDDRLDARAAARFGRRPRPAVRVQVEQLRRRLQRFADVQAAQTREGWRIRADLIETRREAAVVVDGQPFTITGTIDRIDEHPERGFRVLDYKTSDAGKPPEKTHLQKGEWVDLQLPLYLNLTETLGLGQPALGYFNLPRNEDDTAVVEARWGDAELGGAMAVRDAVIRGLRERVFWPPSLDPPSYEDAFTRVAADRAPGRTALIGGEA